MKPKKKVVFNFSPKALKEIQTVKEKHLVATLSDTWPTLHPSVELRHVIEERDQLKQQLENCKAKVTRIEDNWSATEVERNRFACEIMTLKQQLEASQRVRQQVVRSCIEDGEFVEKENTRLKQQLLASEAKIERLKILENVGYSEMDYEPWKKEWTSIMASPPGTTLTEALKPVRASVEGALDSLCDGASAKQYDPSWIRPMGMSKAQVQEACVQAYHQIQQARAALDKLQGISWN